MISKPRGGMAIFSNEILEKCQSENNKFLTDKQIKKFTNKFESNSLDLGDEWEIVVLNVFSKCGEIIYEPDNLGGESRPDLYFIFNKENNIEFLADIRTVSDKGIDEKFPHQKLERKFFDLLFQNGFNRNHFGINVGNNLRELSRDKNIKPKLHMPSNEEEFNTKIFNEEFFTFLEEIKASPKECRDYLIRDNETAIRIDYDPFEFHSRRIAPNHKRITTINSNPMKSALENKAIQLHKSGYTGNKGIIICDGGYSEFNSLASPSYQFSGKDYNVREVIKAMLNKYSDIGFVLTLGVDPYYPGPKKVFGKIFHNNKFNDFGCGLKLILKHIHNLFPKPANSLNNLTGL